MAVRSIWKGSLTFGLVNVSVRLIGAIDEQAVRFNMLHRTCGKRITAPRTCDTCGVRVPSEEIVKGFEAAEDQYVSLTDEDLDQLPLPGLKAVQVHEFTQADRLDPRQINKSYFLAPDTGTSASSRTKRRGLTQAQAPAAFALLVKGMERTGLVAIGTFAMRDREHLAVVRPYGDTLLLQTLYRTDELRGTQEIAQELPVLDEKALGLAEQLIRQMQGNGDMAKYPDRYRQAVLELIDIKLKGGQVTAMTEPDKPETDDVVSALLASIGQQAQAA